MESSCLRRYLFPAAAVSVSALAALPRLFSRQKQWRVGRGTNSAVVTARLCTYMLQANREKSNQPPRRQYRSG